MLSDGQSISTYLSSISMSLSKLSCQRPEAESENTIFHRATPASISIEQYLQRIVRYAHCSEPVFIITLIYIDRLKTRNRQLTINEFSIHRIVITAFVLAVKYHDDFYYKNPYYAKIGGISKEQMNQLEVQFLKLINYDVHVEERLYKIYFQNIQYSE